MTSSTSDGGIVRTTSPVKVRTCDDDAARTPRHGEVQLAVLRRQLARALRGRVRPRRAPRGAGSRGSRPWSTAPALAGGHRRRGRSGGAGAGAAGRGAGRRKVSWPISKVIVTAVIGRPRADLSRLNRRPALSRRAREQQGVVGELLLQGALELRVDLADAALGHAEDVADLAQREVLDVEQDGDLALALGQRVEGAAELVLAGLGGRGLLGVEALVAVRRACRCARRSSRRRRSRAC